MSARVPSGRPTDRRAPAAAPDCAWPRCPHVATLSGYCAPHAAQIEGDHDRFAEEEWA